MKQTRLLRTLLAAVCLFVGTSAWGDETRTLVYSNDFETSSDWTAKGKTDGWTCNPGTTTANTFASKVIGVGAGTGDMGLVSPTMGIDPEKISIVDVEMKFKMDACTSGKSSGVEFITSDVNINNGYVSSGTPFFSINASASGNGYWGTIAVGGNNYTTQLNQSAVTYENNTLNRNSTGIVVLNARFNFTTKEVTFTLKNASSETLVESTTVSFANENATTLDRIFIHAGKTYGGVTIDDVNVYSVESNKTYANYTVKYVSTIADVETDIKSSVQREGEVDATVTLNNADKNIITYGNHKYYYVSDNASSSTIKDDNSTVVKVVFAQATFDDGNYYLKNKATGAYFAAGKNWGTQAITNTQGGHRIGFEVLPTGKYKLNTYIYRDQSSSSDLHYLNANFCDGDAEEWQIVDAGEGYYTISNGSGNLTGGNVNEALSITDGTGDNTKWQILTAAQRKADIETLMESATSANGVDATFYITAPGFAWADLDDRAAWQGSPTFGGFDNKGSGRFWNAEKFTNPYAAFDVYQELTGLKPGAYKITMQGFYRNGFDNVSDDNDNLAILYANSAEVPLVNINKYGYEDNTHSAEGFTTAKSGYYVPDSQSDAAKAFNAGNFENELYVVVGNDGNLRIGVKKDAATGADSDWAVFDNFQLTYYGNAVSATITPTGYATFSSPYALDFSNQIENLEGAYYASAVEKGKVTMTKLEQTVPAETGLFLKGNANATVTIPVAASGTDINGTNHLKPNTSESTVAASTENVHHYVFAYTTSDNSNPGFFNLGNSVTLGAGKAYIETETSIKPTVNAKVSILFTDTELTGVVNAEANETTNAKAGKIYNIAGQVVTESYKGIKIIDGKKVF